MTSNLFKEILLEIKKTNPELGESLLKMNHLREEGNCPLCLKPGPFSFTDEKSIKEFELSGICQECQDNLF